MQLGLVRLVFSLVPFFAFVIGRCLWPFFAVVIGRCRSLVPLAEVAFLFPIRYRVLYWFMSLSLPVCRCWFGRCVLLIGRYRFGALVLVSRFSPHARSSLESPGKI